MAALCGRGLRRVAALLLALSPRAHSYGAAQDGNASSDGVGPGQDPRPLCAAAPGAASELQQRFGLPDVVAVNWGQWHGPYSLPPELLVVCADGRGSLWTQAKRESGYVVSRRTLGPPQIAQLFQLILTEWPQYAPERRGEDGKFIWLLDADYNFIVAPVMQARGLDGTIEEVKHGDLSPGITFFGDNAAAGPYRGVARFGGELNLAGGRDGREWLMHAKSGYTAYRVPVEKARKYYDEMRRAGKGDREIARNFQRCVFRDIFRGRTPLAQLLCYLRRHLRIGATPGVTQQCDIRSKHKDGLPDLVECVPKDAGDAQACTAEAEAGAGAPIVHLVDWYAPGQDRCNHTLAEFEALLQSVADNIKTFVAFHPSVESSAGGRAYAKSISKKIRSLRKHACLYTESFARQLHCNVHGCFEEGLTQELKQVERTFGNILLEGGQLEASWQRAERMWAQCKSGRTGDEL